MCCMYGTDWLTGCLYFFCNVFVIGRQTIKRRISLFVMLQATQAGEGGKLVTQ